MKRAWIVLPDLLSIRVFVDTGIVAGSSRSSISRQMMAAGSIFTTLLLCVTSTAHIFRKAKSVAALTASCFVAPAFASIRTALTSASASRSFIRVLPVD